MGKRVEIDEDVLRQYEAVAVAIREGGAEHLLKSRVEALDVMLDPYRENKGQLVELIQDGYEEHGSGERLNLEPLRKTVEDIFKGSDWAEDLVMAVLKDRLPKLAVENVSGFFTRSSLLDALSKEFFGPKDPNKQLADNIKDVPQA